MEKIDIQNFNKYYRKNDGNATLARIGHVNAVIEEMNGNLIYLEQLAQNGGENLSGFKKITIPLGIQNEGTIEINSQNYNYYTLNEENLFFGQGFFNSVTNNVLNDDLSFYEDSDGLMHIGSTGATPAVPV
jgi:hypothetical protein